MKLLRKNNHMDLQYLNNMNKLIFVLIPFISTILILISIPIVMHGYKIPAILIGSFGLSMLAIWLMEI